MKARQYLRAEIMWTRYLLPIRRAAFCTRHLRMFEYQSVGRQFDDTVQNHRQRSRPLAVRQASWRLTIFHVRRSLILSGMRLLLLGLMSACGANLFFGYDAAIAATFGQNTIAVEVPASVLMNRVQPAWLEIPMAAAPIGSPMQRPTDSATESLPLANSVVAAPSRLWLIAMPAVPVVGGLLIYGLRKLSGKL